MTPQPVITTRRDPEANARLRRLIAEGAALRAPTLSQPVPQARDEQPAGKAG